MTIRMSITQASAYRALSDEFKTPTQLGHTIATLDGLVKAGYAKVKREPGWPPMYAKGDKEL